MEREWFKTWFDSPFYHLLYFRHNEEEACRFIDRLLQLLQPPPGAAMLDTGCGRGRHAKYLADKGFDVVGLDLSPVSIEAAKEMERDNLHFFEHDMRLPYAANLFDYCFNFFTSFGYFRTQRENENAIRTMAQALRPGGKLIIDYLNTPFVEAHFVEQNEAQIDGVHFNISRRQNESFFYKTIEIKEEGTITESFTEQVRKYNLDDFTAMLQKQNMQNIQVFGNYELEPYAAALSPRMIIIAERKHTT
jgi:SAM-dependent methyltransferase